MTYLENYKLIIFTLFCHLSYVWQERQDLLPLPKHLKARATDESSSPVLGRVWLPRLILESLTSEDDAEVVIEADKDGLMTHSLRLRTLTEAEMLGWSTCWFEALIESEIEGTCALRFRDRRWDGIDSLKLRHWYLHLLIPIRSMNLKPIGSSRLRRLRFAIQKLTLRRTDSAETEALVLDDSLSDVDSLIETEAETLVEALVLCDSETDVETDWLAETEALVLALADSDTLNELETDWLIETEALVLCGVRDWLTRWNWCLYLLTRWAILKHWLTLKHSLNLKPIGSLKLRRLYLHFLILRRSMNRNWLTRWNWGTGTYWPLSETEAENAGWSTFWLWDAQWIRNRLARWDWGACALRFRDWRWDWLTRWNRGTGTYWLT